MGTTNNKQKVTMDPDVLELTDKSIEYLPFNWALGREGEDKSVRSNVGPDFHLGLPTPEVLLPLCAPHPWPLWPLVKVAGNEHGSLCSDSKHGVGLPVSCSSPDTYGMQISSILMTEGPMRSGYNSIPILEYACMTFWNALPAPFLYALAPGM